MAGSTLLALTGAKNAVTILLAEMNFPYYLGCPIWSNSKWVGKFFTTAAKPGDFLRQYSSVFNTVEGNTTFYALPKPASVAKWREDTPDTFKFCFKFPQMISHHLRLQSATAETQAFFKLLAPLGERLGPFFLQLPPSFDGDELPVLRKFLTSLPAEFKYAVEARHLDFFDPNRAEKKLDELLDSFQMGRVIFDTRGLHAAEVSAEDRLTRDAKRRKPKVPVRFTVTANLPFMRFVGHPVIEKNEFHLNEWARWVVKYLQEGTRTFVFMHAPDDFYAPALARYFHELVFKMSKNAGELPAWPCEKETKPVEQLRLF